MISATHLHAMFVHFPIALVFAGFLSELLGLFFKKDFFKKAGLYLIVLGAAGAVASYFSGNAAEEAVEHGPFGAALEMHEQAALVTTILAVAAAAFRVLWEYMKTGKNWVYAVSLLLYAATAGAMARTGYLGGHLVYEHGAGIELASPAMNEPAPDSEADEDMD